MDPGAHEDDRDAPVAVVVVRHGVAVRTRRRYGELVADLGGRQGHPVDEDVAALAVASDHRDGLEVRTVETAYDAGFEALLEQGHLEVVAHTTVDSNEGGRTPLDRRDAIDRRGGLGDH